jgi:hypothetical protein
MRPPSVGRERDRPRRHKEIALRQSTSFFGTAPVTLLAIVLATPAAIGLSAGSRNEGPSDTPQSAQDPCAQVLVAQGNAEGLHRRCEAIGAGGGAARGDFNGDGIADLAIGVPYEDVNGLGAVGAVNVIYGSTSGISTSFFLGTADQFITSTALSVIVSPGANDHFGSALAAGDFDGDGFSDLAISAPDYDVHGPGSNDGQVVTINGSATGLLLSTTTIVTVGVSSPGERRGAALVWADFNGDGFGDLAVGNPNATVRGDGLFCSEITLDVANAGRVDVYYGSQTGLTGFGAQSLKQGVCDYPDDEAGLGHDSPEGGDRFGAALAALPNARGGADLVIGAPMEDLALFDKRDAGVVHIVRGGSSGLATTSSTSNQLLSQDTPGVGGAAESGDQFGRVLATGNFSGNREALVVGIPFEDVVDNTKRDGGAIQVFFRGGTQHVATDDSLFIGQVNLANVSAETGDLMGWALAVGDFDFDGRDDLAVGTPGEDVNQWVDAGMVSVLYGDAAGLSTTRIQHWHQDSTGILDFLEGGDQFGYALSAWNYGRTRHADLAIGVPFETVQSAATGSNQIHAGAVNVIYGSGDGLNASGNQVWTQDTLGVDDTAEPDDRFGSALY